MTQCEEWVECDPFLKTNRRLWLKPPVEPLEKIDSPSRKCYICGSPYFWIDKKRKAHCFSCVGVLHSLFLGMAEVEDGKWKPWKVLYWEPASS